MEHFDEILTDGPGDEIDTSLFTEVGVLQIGSMLNLQEFESG